MCRGTGTADRFTVGTDRERHRRRVSQRVEVRDGPRRRMPGRFLSIRRQTISMRSLGSAALRPSRIGPIHIGQVRPDVGAQLVDVAAYQRPGYVTVVMPRSSARASWCSLNVNPDGAPLGGARDAQDVGVQVHGTVLRPQERDQRADQRAVDPSAVDVVAAA